MMWGRAARKRAEMRRRVAALEEAVAQLGAAAEQDRERQGEASRLAAEQAARQAEEVASRVASIEERLGKLEGRSGDLLDAEQLAHELKPIRAEVARADLQAVSDERQAQRAYLELLRRLERIECRHTGPAAQSTGDGGDPARLI